VSGSAETKRPHELDRHAGDDAICLHGVSYAYDQEVVVENVSLHVLSGSRLGIVGPNGGGKSTLLRLVLGLLRPQRGTVTVFGRSPREACRRSWIGYVPQRHDVEYEIPLSVGQVVLLGRSGRAGLLRGWNREDRAESARALEAVGMAHLAERPIGDLSGGQQQRVFIARALASRPRILVLDEPMVGIDQAGQQRFAELMDGLHARYRLTLLIVSHDLRAIASGCDQIACLNRRLHYHAAPDGLTREVLAEVFEHDITAAALQPAGAETARPSEPGAGTGPG